MRIMQKIARAFRGGVRESAEVIIDANSLRIFAQEIHECDNHIRQTKQQLASIIAEKARVKREIDANQSSIEKIETRIDNFLENDDEASALKLATLMAEKEGYLERNQNHHKQLQDHVLKLEQTLQKIVSRLNGFQSEYRMAKSTGKMQNAQSKLASRSQGASAKFGDMQDSLDRIKDRQQQFSDEIEAMDQIDANLSGVSVNDDAISTEASAQEILSRIKNKRAEVLSDV